MLTEEALLFLVTLGACVLVVLGTLELVAPTRPRHPRRPPPRTPSRLVAARVAASAAAGNPGAVLRVAVDRCAALFAQKQYAAVVADATAALAPGGAASGSAPADLALLWSLVGQSQHAVGDDDGARVALESALAVAPSAARAEHAGRLAALALTVARARLDDAVTEQPREPQERLGSVRDAIEWLERALALCPDDAALTELRTAARAALWPAYDQAVSGLVQRHDYHETRRLLGEALRESEVPLSRQHAFRALLSATFSSEIGHLSAQAFRSLRDSRQAEALASLQRAETLIAVLPDDALPTRRREEIARRLLQGYTRLGRRHVDSGDFEAAMEPLLRALRLPTRSDEGGETRTVLVRALEGVVEARAPVIQHVAEGGDRPGAIVQCKELWALLASAHDAGLTQDDLQGALARARRLAEALDAPV
jgi:tetratricopeptide (TPR) repeat protein